jgi:hypothetical protein
VIVHYLLILHVEEARLATPDPDLLGEYGKLLVELKSNGTLLAASRLKPGATIATAIGGAPQVTDGPYAETREQIGGFFLIDVPDREAAVQIALRLPASRHGTIEIREIGFTA